MFFSLFVGGGSAFVAWAASFALIDLADAQTRELTEHQLVILGTSLLVVFALATLRSTIEPMLTMVSATAAVAAMWETRAFPDSPTYSQEYWSVIVIATLVFMTLVVVLNSNFLFRSRR